MKKCIKCGAELRNDLYGARCEDCYADGQQGDNTMPLTIRGREQNMVWSKRENRMVKVRHGY